MDERVRRAMAKWPNVPALYGWLRLDLRGRWLIRDEPVSHPGLIDFISRNYACDDRGCWYFQNGPQRGYVNLDYTPWVLHVDNAGQLRTHTNVYADIVTGGVIDDVGNLLLVIPQGPGLIHSDSLVTVCEWFTDDRGSPVDADELSRQTQALSEGHATTLRFDYRGNRAPVSFVRRAEIPQRFEFVPQPQAESRQSAEQGH